MSTQTASEETHLAAAKAGESTPARRPRTYAVHRGVVWLSAVVLLAVGAAGTVAGWQVVRQHQQDVAASAALEAARSYAVTLTTTDLGAIDQNFTDVLDGATGGFKDTYTKASSQLRKMLIDNKVSTTGAVLDAAVKSVDNDDVDVLLAVKQTVTNAQSPDPRTDFVSISVTMRKVADRWLAAEVVLAGSGVGGDH